MRLCIAEIEPSKLPHACAFRDGSCCGSWRLHTRCTRYGLKFFVHQVVTYYAMDPIGTRWRWHSSRSDIKFDDVSTPCMPLRESSLNSVRVQTRIILLLQSSGHRFAISGKRKGKIMVGSLPSTIVLAPLRSPHTINSLCIYIGRSSGSKNKGICSCTYLLPIGNERALVLRVLLRYQLFSLLMCSPSVMQFIYEGG